jgi:hypothetical protein
MGTAKAEQAGFFQVASYVSFYATNGKTYENSRAAQLGAKFLDT